MTTPKLPEPVAIFHHWLSVSDSHKLFKQTTNGQSLLKDGDKLYTAEQVHEALEIAAKECEALGRYVDGRNCASIVRAFKEQL
jgi:hypothetical protein